MLKRTSARLPLLALLLAHAAACSSYPSATSKEAMAPPPSHYAMAEMTAAPSTEAYQDYGVNPLVDVDKDRFSTFAIDVDTASYAISRRKLVEGALPPVAAVRAEEFLNAFDYAYEAPKRRALRRPHDGRAFALRRRAPRPARRPPGQAADREAASPAHLVYLVDTSGSMQSADKLGLAKKSLKPDDRARSSPATPSRSAHTRARRARSCRPPGSRTEAEILDAIEQLTSSGGTAMSSGMDNAYASRAAP
jgi:Ca-activated chloride channel family protein